MQTLDPPCNPTVDSHAPDLSAMSDDSSPIHSQNDDKTLVESNARGRNKNNDTSHSVVVKRERPSRACTQRAAARLAAAAEAEAEMAEKERKRKRARKEKSTARVLKEESEEEGSFGMEDEGEGDEDGEEENGGDGGGSPSSSKPQCGKIVTQLVEEVEPTQVPRWNIRSMWQLASILNFLNVFRPLLNIKVEFSAEELETALLTPNNTLGDVHMPLLKAIPPVTRMALGHKTWVTVLCRKLRDWWHWVAEGDLPIVASHGAEVEAYSALDPAVRVVILKALCDIRVEQEDIRNYIDDSMKHGVHLSAFRKERIGGDSHGISYWYEDDPLIGHRLYREIRKVEVKRGKGKSVPPIPHSSYQWETVATNFDEFLNVSEKLFSSKNRTEIAVGKKLKNNMLPEIEKVHKRKEKQLKKQHRQALMLDNMISMDVITAGRSLRDRKPVTYTFDDYDRSINDAINVPKKKQLSPEPFGRREPPLVKMDDSSNGKLGGDSPPQYPPHESTFSAVSPNSFEEDDDDDRDNEDGYHDDREKEMLDRSNRRRQKPQRYSVNDFVDPLSDNDPDFESDEDIVGEVVYDEEYLRKRNNKRRKTSSSSESEEEYHFEEENPEEEDEEEEEEEDEDNNSSNTDEDSDNPNPRKLKAPRGRTRHGTKLRSVGELQSGLRRSERSTRNRINYQQYEMSESETELPMPEKSNALQEHYDASDNEDGDNGLSMGSPDFEENADKEEVVMPENGLAVENHESNAVDDEKMGPREDGSNGVDQEGDDGGVREKRRFLDLNELAPGSGFDDGPALNRDENDEF